MLSSDEKLRDSLLLNMDFLTALELLTVRRSYVHNDHMSMAKFTTTEREDIPLTYN